MLIHADCVSEMQPGPIRDRTVDDYAEFIDEERETRIADLAAGRADTRVLHLNSAATGGGVAELLRSLVPLATDAGVPNDWHVMSGPDAFFEVTKTLHNGLQGDQVKFTDEMRRVYESTVRDEALELMAATDITTYDVLVVHDPQPLGLVPHLRDEGLDAAVVWRCHIDLTDPAPGAVEFLRPAVDTVDHLVVSRPGFGDALAKTGIAPSRRVIHPSIDPLTDKNRPLSAGERDTVSQELSEVPLDEAPVVTQVSRFDPWKDPEGVVEVYERVRRTVPDVHLVLAGGMAEDDPEAVEVYETVVGSVGDDPAVHLLQDLSDTAVNRLQRASTLVLQKSLREGFALTVSEALWKETPVVGADVGGIPLQIQDGVNGFLVDPHDYEATAEKVQTLLSEPERARDMGSAGREHVRQRFLFPRHLVDYLELFETVM